MRLRAQHLQPAALADSMDVDQTVYHMLGIQAQEASSAALGIWARDKSVTAEAVEAAQIAGRSIVRTWGFRGTLYLLASDDLSWLLPLLGPVFISKSRRRYKQLGLSEEVRVTATREIISLLAQEGARSRAQIAEHLVRRGIPVEGQAIYHLLRHAGLQGAICFGPVIEGKPTFVRLADWIPSNDNSLDEDVHAALVLRYLRSHGPAQIEDIVSWTGLPVGAIKSGIMNLENDLIEIEIASNQAWMLASQAGWLAEKPLSQPVVNLLPAYDPYLLGYRTREFFVDDRFARRIHPGGGFLRPTVILDGMAIATWKLTSGQDRLEIIVESFERLDDVTMGALAGEVEALGRFYGSEAIIKFTNEV